MDPALFPSKSQNNLLSSCEFTAALRVPGTEWELQTYTLAGTSPQPTNGRAFDDATQGTGQRGPRSSLGSEGD